jgi:hypothetical protein
MPLKLGERVLITQLHGCVTTHTHGRLFDTFQPDSLHEGISKLKNYRTIMFMHFHNPTIKSRNLFMNLNQVLDQPATIAKSIRFGAEFGDHNSVFAIG